jgi:plastocyanin
MRQQHRRGDWPGPVRRPKILLRGRCCCCAVLKPASSLYRASSTTTAIVAAETTTTEPVTNNGSSSNSNDAAANTTGVSIVSGASTLTDSAFQPDPVNVSILSTVTWANHDLVPHTVTPGENGQADGKLNFTARARPIETSNFLTLVPSQISLAIHNNNSHLSSATESVTMTDCCASVVFLPRRRGGLQFLFAIVVGVNAAAIS